MKLKKRRLTKSVLVVVVVVIICLIYGSWRLYQSYRDDMQLEVELARTYDYEAMVKDYQEYPDSVLVKSDQPRVAFNEAYHSPDGYYYLSPVFKHDKSELKKPAPKGLSDIQWYRYGFTSDEQKIYFSFEFPEHGIYCEGCFDGWPYNNFVPNATGSWITGGHYYDRVRDRELPRLWSLTAGIVILEPSLFFNATDPAYPGEKDTSLEETVMTLLDTQIGQTVQINDRYSQSKIIVERLADISCGTYTCFYYKSSGREATEYALVNKKTYVVMFTYEHTDPVFDLLPRIVGSYSEGVDQSITHGRFPRVSTLDGYEIIPE